MSSPSLNEEQDVASEFCLVFAIWTRNRAKCSLKPFNSVFRLTVVTGSSRRQTLEKTHERPLSTHGPVHKNKITSTTDTICREISSTSSAFKEKHLAPPRD